MSNDRASVDERQHSDVVKDCHSLPQEAPVVKERELRRIATHAGMYEVPHPCRGYSGDM
jgi:hypothetical protein